MTSQTVTTVTAGRLESTEEQAIRSAETRARLGKYAYYTAVTVLTGHGGSIFVPKLFAKLPESTQREAIALLVKTQTLISKYGQSILKTIGEKIPTKEAAASLLGNMTTAVVTNGTSVIKTISDGIQSIDPATAQKLKMFGLAATAASGGTYTCYKVTQIVKKVLADYQKLKATSEQATAKVIELESTVQKKNKIINNNKYALQASKEIIELLKSKNNTLQQEQEIAIHERNTALDGWYAEECNSGRLQCEKQVILDKTTALLRNATELLNGADKLISTQNNELSTARQTNASLKAQVRNQNNELSAAIARQTILEAQVRTKANKTLATLTTDLDMALTNLKALQAKHDERVIKLRNAKIYELDKEDLLFKVVNERDINKTEQLVERYNAEIKVLNEKIGGHKAIVKILVNALQPMLGKVVPSGVILLTQAEEVLAQAKNELSQQVNPPVSSKVTFASEHVTLELAQAALEKSKEKLNKLKNELSYKQKVLARDKPDKQKYDAMKNQDPFFKGRETARIIESARNYMATFNAIDDLTIKIAAQEQIIAAQEKSVRAVIDEIRAEDTIAPYGVDADERYMKIRNSQPQQ